MRRRSLLWIATASLAVAALAWVARGGSPSARSWRARLASLAVDRDADLRNNLLAAGGDPFALRRDLLAAPAVGADAQGWRDFVALAAAPRPDYDAIDRVVSGLVPDQLARGASDAYRYLQLWAYWQRNRPGNAAATLEALAGVDAAAAARQLAREAGPDGAVQLVVPGPVRTAGASAEGPRFRLRRLLPLATRRLAVSWSAASGAASGRIELVALSAAGIEFARLATLPDGALEITTPRATVRGGATRAAAGNRLRLVWDAVREEVTVVGADGVELRAPGAAAPLEPPAEIELALPGAAMLRDLVVAAAPRGASTI